MSLIQSIEKSLLRIMQDKIREFGSLNNLNDEQINATLERMDLGKSLTMPLVVRKSAAGLKGKVEKEKKIKMISLPFSKSCVKEELCGALEYNQGLFTQCPKKHLEDGIYCGSCQEETMQTDNGAPSCGTVEDRLSKGLMEFRDAKGRAPISYLNYLKKKNSSVEEARSLAEEKGETIDEEHFEERRGRPKKASDESQVGKSEKRGRPKKAPVQVKSATTFDIFTSSVASLVEHSTSSSSVVVEEVDRSTSSSSVVVVEECDHSTSSSSDEDNASVTISENQVIEVKKVKRSKEEKEAKKQEKEAKYQEKLALEKEKEAKKLAAEQEKAAKKLAAEQEKEAKKQAAEQEKSAKKLAAEQEKAAKKSEKKPKKSSAKEETKSTEPSNNASASSNAKKEEEEERPKVQVEEFKFEGVTYWKSSENLLYNPTTQECVGTWCISKNTILPPPEEDSDEELEEEEYDDEDDERND